MMDYQLDKVTWDRISGFAMIFSVLSTTHVGPLPDLVASSPQIEVAPCVDLTASASVDLMTVVLLNNDSY